jgi:hypothetical protein
MTNLTHMIIATREDVYVAAFGKDKFGFLIELGEYHRPLVSSEEVFDTSDAAIAAGTKLVSSIKSEAA